MDQIPGEIFSPCFLTEEEFEAGYQSSQFWTDKDFYNEYRKHMVAMSHVASCAKIYVLNNYKKVTDWSGLEVTIIHGPSGKETTYYTYCPRKKLEKARTSKTWDKMLERLDKADQERHNPLLEFTEVVLDPTDGDFSVTLNGDQEHWWIQDEAIIIIANYIEDQLKK